MASIYKRNGVYNVVVTYTDENGKRRQKRMRGQLSSDAKNRFAYCTVAIASFT